jgi:hypothetical protein
MGFIRSHTHLIAAAMAAAAAAVWLALAGFQILDRIQFVSSEEGPAISSGREIVQSLTAAGENISRVDLVLSQQNQEARGGELQLELVPLREEGETSGLVLGEALRQARLDTGSFSYPSVISFEFDPVPVTPGGGYAIRLTSNSPEGSAVTPAMNPKDEYAGGRLYVDGAPQPGDLYFAVFHRAGAGGLLKKIEPWRPFPLDRSPFYIILFLTGAAATGWLLAEMAGGVTSPAKDGGGKPPPAGPAAP